jgi:NMD protein affecting ribosome stability and mRNA decay
MSASGKNTDVARQGRGDRLLREMDHDPYHSKRKPPEPTTCPECGAVFHRGRWQWGEAPAGAHEETCPACRRIKDRVPAGFLNLKGEFLSGHRDEILHLIRNVEEKEKAEHPLQRIMDVETGDEGVTITFTDPHLARSAGTAVHHAYQGELDFHYEDEDILLRVNWSR